MEDTSFSTIIDIENSSESPISSASSKSTLCFSGSTVSNNEKNPLLKGKKSPLIITVLQIVAADQYLKDLHLMIKVGANYYKGERFQLGAETRSSVLPQYQKASVKVAHSPIVRGADDTLFVSASDLSKTNNLQSNANLGLCQKFIFWVSLHSELFDFIHVRKNEILIYWLD